MFLGPSTIEIPYKKSQCVTNCVEIEETDIHLLKVRFDKIDHF